MKKNIKMNKEQMEVNKYRAIIPYGEEEIKIKNIDKELRNKIVEIVAESVENGKELDNDMLINMLVEELTNVEFEVDITEIEEPSHVVSLILYYINEIVTELSEEILLASQMVVNNKKVELMNQEEKEKVIEEAKEIQEKIEKKDVRKPKRSRGKIARR